jgi:hypothetical protein
MTEIWVDVVGYEGLYQVSHLGRVKRVMGKDSRGNLRNERVLKPRLIGGYLIAHLCKDGVASNKAVHRLVAEAFIDNPQNLPEVNHRDGCKENNYYLNLEWVSPSGNSLHAYALGLRTPNKTFQGRVGRLHPRSKLVYCVELDTVYDNARFASEATGCNETKIRDCCRGERITCGGYHWRYV